MDKFIFFKGIIKSTIPEDLSDPVDIMMYSVGWRAASNGIPSSENPHFTEEGRDLWFRGWFDRTMQDIE